MPYPDADMVVDVRAGDATTGRGGEERAVPAGWFAIAHRGELRGGRAVPRRLAGRELAVFCTASGRVAALPGYCPHLGAHLGHGGRVEGETLVCPFHGFRFDASGRCVGTAYGSPPPRGLVTSCVDVRVVGDVVLAWHSPDGRGPTFEVPASSAEDLGPWRFARRRLTGHPQDTTENSVDLGHFSTLHGYAEVEQIAPLEVDGARLRIAYRARRPARVLRSGRPGLEILYEIEAWGLGWSRVDVTVPRYGIRLGQLVLSTPTAPGRVDVLLGAAVTGAVTGAGGEPSQDAAAPPTAAVEVASPAVQRTVERLVAGRGFRVAAASGLLLAVVVDVAQDARIWRHKTYVDQPALAVGDGPIVPYRRWAQQFYPPGR
jgi:nitrite reductase/ring-hydroxylating ferredoxin subunit